MGQLVKHRTTERILDILELVAAHSEGMLFKEISKEMDIPKSSLHPLVQTLLSRRYLSFRDNERYYLGDHLFILGSKFVGDVDLMEQISAQMAAFTAKTSETAYFGVLSGGEVLYLLKNEPKNSIRVAASVGGTLPAYGTGLGKALLSQFDEKELQMLYPQPLQALTPHTITDITQLAQQCARIREEGFAYEKEESTKDIQCVAAPIVARGRTLAALSVAVPVYRYHQNQEQLFKQELKITAKNIAKLIEANKEQWGYS